jgi:hypothetical protein
MVRSHKNNTHNSHPLWVSTRYDTVRTRNTTSTRRWAWILFFYGRIQDKSALTAKSPLASWYFLFHDGQWITGIPGCFDLNLITSDIKRINTLSFFLITRTANTLSILFFFLKKSLHARFKMTVVSWLALYPAVTLIFWLFGPLLADLPLLIRTFAVTAVVIVAMTYFLMPFMTKTFSFWLYPKKNNNTES